MPEGGHAGAGASAANSAACLRTSAALTPAQRVSIRTLRVRGGLGEAGKRAGPKLDQRSILAENINSVMQSFTASRGHPDRNQ
jgi:hypothetical protein